MKKLMSVLLAVLLVLSLGLPTAFAEDAEAAAEGAETRELTEEELAVALHVIENFVALSQVPRPNGHEEKISAFFKQWAEEQGLNPVQDEVLNVIFDVPATKGYEDWPMVGLQAHMDMVCVGDSPDYDPENDPITVVVDYDAVTMTADGTSLGGDDGIGCAIIMSMVQGLAPHGPLRVILTVDEEGFMKGIANLDPSVVADLKYLVNVDSETSDAVTVSTAGGYEIDIDCDNVDVKAPDGDLAVTVAVSGLAGGHSGVDIDKGRQNAIYVLDSVLKEIAAEGIFFEIASMEGGQASNAIPDSADALLVIRSEDFEKLSSAVADQEAKWKARAAADPGLTITSAKADGMPEKVIAPEFAVRVQMLLDGLVNG
ncbi:MAG: peptidase dimerization domain-containing protein, partial [Oscillospiraceae bacterium]|nr:peptidase dimerization domain-containing protein [Oscillospiraceae bacterium]